MLFDPSHLVLQQLDYLAYLDIYHEHIRMFHVKDAEFRPNGRQGIYGGYSGWTERAGRFRSSATARWTSRRSSPSWRSTTTRAGPRWNGNAASEWEDGAREGVDFINRHIIHVTERVFDDFAGAAVDQSQIRAMLGIA